MKRVIGLIPLVDDARESFWMLPGYMEGVAAAGGLPVMLPLTDGEADLEQLFRFCDGFVLTGGHDVAPERYGQARLPQCGDTSPGRDRMEAALLRLAIDRDRPVLGICRGLQFINAALGGTLWQDLPTQRPSDICHRQRPPYDVPAHPVAVLPGTPLARLAGTDRLEVNSCHHQAVRDLAPALRPMALSPDGLVEALWHPERRFLWGVQWHPEFAWRGDAVARSIFQSLVDACDP